MSDPRLEGFTPVVRLIERIVESGNQYPKVRLAFGNEPLVLSMCGEKSRTPGAVNLTDGGSYGNNKWYGRISAEGILFAGETMRRLTDAHKRALWDLLTRLKDGDAEAVFSEYGHKFGMCCMCGRELTNEKSIALGIGPICRAKAFGGQT